MTTRFSWFTTSSCLLFFLFYTHVYLFSDNTLESPMSSTLLPHHWAGLRLTHSLPSDCHLFQSPVSWESWFLCSQVSNPPWALAQSIFSCLFLRFLICKMNSGLLLAPPCYVEQWIKSLRNLELVRCNMPRLLLLFSLSSPCLRSSWPNPALPSLFTMQWKPLITIASHLRSVNLGRPQFHSHWPLNSLHST